MDFWDRSTESLKEQESGDWHWITSKMENSI